MHAFCRGHANTTGLWPVSGDVISLGVTGGIGSGKSTVSQMLAKYGCGWVLDADQIARSVTLPGGKAIAALAREFGDDIIGADGAMNRATVRQRAFTEPSFRHRLEAIIHPLVHDAFRERHNEALVQGVPLLIYDIPLLVESMHWRQRLPFVVVVDCSEQTQIQRVQARNGLDVQEVRNIIQAQATRKQRLSAADAILCNEHISLDELGKQCQQLSNILGLQSIAKDSA